MLDSASSVSFILTVSEKLTNSFNSMPSATPPARAIVDRLFDGPSSVGELGARLPREPAGNFAASPDSEKTQIWWWMRRQAIAVSTG